MSDLDLARVQGNLLAGFQLPRSVSLWVRLPEPGRARAWLRDIAPAVTSGAAQRDADPLDRGLLVALTWPGLAALGAPRAWLEQFPAAFREGMRARARARLGDRDGSDPDRWEAPFGPGDAPPHALVWLHGTDVTIDELEARERARLEAHGAEVCGRQAAGALPPLPGDPPEMRREHFGFSDGFSQPWVREAPVPGYEGDGTPVAGGGTVPVALGEFVMGHLNEDGEPRPLRPAVRDVHRDGSYLVWRKLSQDVPGFFGWCDEQAPLLNGSSDEVAAKVVGRWRDGTPLDRSPHRPDPEMVSAADLNDFTYAGDPRGLRCPIGAHTRRASPRASMGWDGRLTRRHRIIRRGQSYGSRLLDPRTGDGEDRGLVFTCFQSDIERQFETVQGAWLADGDPFGLGRQPDPLIGGADPHGRYVIPREERPPALLSPLAEFIVARGGAYLLTPGLPALAALGDGSAWA